MTPVEEADQFTTELYELLLLGEVTNSLLNIEFDVQRIGFGVIKVQLPSGTELLIEVSAQ